PIALAVPPVETSSTPALARARAKSTSPVLSKTDSRARRTGTRSGAGTFFEGTAMGDAFLPDGECRRPSTAGVEFKRRERAGADFVSGRWVSEPGKAMRLAHPWF